MSKEEVIASLRLQIDAMQQAGSEECYRTNTQHACEKESGTVEKPSRSNKRDNSDRAKKRLHEEDEKSAFRKIMALVNVSDRSEHSIRERLARDGFDATDIDESVQRAKECGFIDDARFAEVLVRSRISQGKGSAGIVRELAEHGIDADEVYGWPFEYPVSYDEELDRALEILKRKPPRSKNRREGAYRRLAQKGYPSSVCASASRIWSESI